MRPSYSRGTPWLELAAVSSSDETKVKADWPAVSWSEPHIYLTIRMFYPLIVIPIAQRYPFPAGEKLRWKPVSALWLINPLP